MNMIPVINSCHRFSAFGQEKAILNQTVQDNPLCNSCLYVNTRDCPAHKSLSYKGNYSE